MADEMKKRELSDEQIDELEAESLPDRENMSLINANVGVPVNAAVAANVLTSQSAANANAQQPTPNVSQTVHH
jgi:hypothetical protein